MPDLSKEQLHTLARLGAEARLAQMDTEVRAIRAAYPDLIGPARRRGRWARVKAAPSAAPTVQEPRAKAKKRYTMSAAQKKAVSERMKKYWAERRKAKKG
jgi:hypothetical protein